MVLLGHTSSLYFLADQASFFGNQPRETSGNSSLLSKNSLLPVNEESYEGLDAEPESPNTQNTEDHYTNDAIQVLQSASIANQSKQPSEDRTSLPETQQQEPTRKKQEPSSKKQQTLSAKPAKRGNDIQTKMLALEEKLNFFKQRIVETDIHKGYDYHFLMSLLPHLKEERKLHVQFTAAGSSSKRDHILKSQPSRHVIFPNRFSRVPALYSTNTTPLLEPLPTSSTQSTWNEFSPTLFSSCTSLHSNSSNRTEINLFLKMRYQRRNSKTTEKTIVLEHMLPFSLVKI